MNKRIQFFTTILMISLSIQASYSQKFDRKSNNNRLEVNANTPELYFQTPNLEKIHTEDAYNDALGMIYRIGVGIDTYITTENSGLWSTKPNGNRVWQLKIHYPGAEALSFMFSKFILCGEAQMSVYNSNGKALHKTYGRDDVLDHGQQNMSLCYSDRVVLELVVPYGAQESIIEINQIFYGYRSTGNPTIAKDFGDSGSCEVNVNCSEGNAWQDEKRGVAKILVVEGGSQSSCTGSLINNLAQNCKPYFLTAFHCGENASVSDMNQWRFYFGYEASGCSNPSTEGFLGDNFITGCVKLASSNDPGITGSDFLLVQMGTLANESSTITTLKSAAFNGYWNGWDATSIASSSGTCIHHPLGDIKKISTYTEPLFSSSWNGGVNAHWAAIWSSTSNGFGITEFGSSGSPVFNNNGGLSRIVGTLTGGSSEGCGVLSQPFALFGKMSYHWNSNGGLMNERLETFLDPNNTGTKVLNGSYNPCVPINLGIEENQALSIITIYPNPTNENLSIDLSSLPGETTLRLFDLSGKLIQTQNTKNGELVKWNIANLANGMYNLEINSELGQTMRKISKF